MEALRADAMSAPCGWHTPRTRPCAPAPLPARSRKASAKRHWSAPPLSCTAQAASRPCQWATCSYVEGPAARLSTRQGLGQHSRHTHQHGCAQPSCQHTPRARGSLLRTSAGMLDVMPTWTLDQLAGIVFGAGMLAAILSARYVDDWVAKQQRKQLGLCETCGGVYDPATCSQDKCPMKNKQ